jgi:hypothetical protein
MNKEINAIMVQNKLSIREARALYNQRNPAISYARIVSQNSQQSQTQSREIEELKKQVNQLQNQLKQQMHENQLLQQQVTQLLQLQKQQVEPAQMVLHLEPETQDEDMEKEPEFQHPLTISKKFQQNLEKMEKSIKQKPEEKTPKNTRRNQKENNGQSSRSRSNSSRKNSPPPKKPNRGNGKNPVDVDDDSDENL